MKKIITLTIIYILMAAFTYGYAHREAMRQCKKDWPSLTPKSLDGFMGAVYPALIWPIYWPFHLSKRYFQDN